MKIAIKLTRKENSSYFGKLVGQKVEVELQDYVATVVASEIGNARIEACKAQAIAARTYAYPYALAGKAVTDSGSKHQAYRAIRYDKSRYPNACDAAECTSGMVLTYNGNVIPTCSYSASNGGRTTSSEQRWGKALPWLVAKDDPWDAASGKSKNGHGVGMSQSGAEYAASIGVTYEDILAFYYVGTEIGRTACSPTSDTSASVGVAYSSDVTSDSAKDGVKMIKADELVDMFRIALSQKWGYIYGTAGEPWTQAKQNAATRSQTVQYGQKWVGKTVADCSGLFTWAFKKLGGYMYHGSNTMFKKYTTASGTLKNGKRTDGKELLAGTALFKYNATDGYHHVGLYVGGNTVIEAKGTYYGVVVSSPSTWTHWGELKGVAYDDSNAGNESTKGTENGSMKATVTTSGGKLNLRKSMTTSSACITQIPNGTQIDVIDNGDEWCKIIYDKKTGYVMSKYLTIKNEATTISELKERVEKLQSTVETLQNTIDSLATKVGG